MWYDTMSWQVDTWQDDICSMDVYWERWDHMDTIHRWGWDEVGRVGILVKGETLGWDWDLGRDEDREMRERYRLGIFGTKDRDEGEGRV